MERQPPRSTRTDTLVPDTTLFRTDESTTTSGAPRWIHAEVRRLRRAVMTGSTLPDTGRNSWRRGRPTWAPLDAEPLIYGTVIIMTVMVVGRSEEHTSELQSLMRISYAVFCLKKKKTHK